ncbi:XRE family transcriptional regulator [Zophobihabitans entericus]|uniref:XRE family transcriptional regulator n=1 Tax=Zophobihabitans entericus TaxID=1635327 RepID=UPI001AAE3609|nr:XRE family transcriptional regulator [Zophobihabitans entericus]
MSSEMEDKLRDLIKIGEQSPEVILLTGSIENANKWEILIHFIAEMAQECDETGYICYPLNDELGLLCERTLSLLQEIGVDIPKEFPKELEEYLAEDEDSDDELRERLHDNLYYDLIFNIYKSLTDVYGFYAAFVYELVMDDELDLFGSVGSDIDSCLLALAASKVDIDTNIASNFRVFKNKTKKDYRKWLKETKNTAIRARIPLRAEIMDLVNNPSHDQLGREADDESMGFNDSRLHPDIYMNELLVGIRIIHQVLPAIMEKLGMQNEFELDESSLRL